jgi:hypothetical protein
LKDGERVVTTGAFGLGDKSKIKIVEPSAEGEGDKSDEKNANEEGAKNANDAKGAAKSSAGDEKK